MGDNLNGNANGEDKIDEGVKITYCAADADKNKTITEFGSAKLDIGIAISSIQVIGHINCYNVCEIIYNIEQLPTPERVLGIVKNMSSEIGKRFSVFIDDLKIFSGLLSAVEYITKDEVEFAVPIEEYSKSANNTGKSVKEDSSDSSCVRVTFISSIQRLETVWKPKSWLDPLVSNEESTKGITLIDDSNAMPNISSIISEVIALSKNTNAFKAERDFTDDLGNASVDLEYALWPNYMSAYDYLVSLCEAAGIIFHVTSDDQVVFGRGGSEIVINGNNSLSYDAKDDFTFMNSVSAYSHGARSNYVHSSEFIGMKKRSFVEGKVGGNGVRNLEVEGADHLSRYMDVIAGTIESSVGMKINSMVANEVRNYGSLNAVFNAGDNSGMVKETINSCPAVKVGDLNGSSRYAVTSYCFLIGECLGSDAASKHGRMHIYANEITPAIGKSAVVGNGRPKSAPAGKAPASNAQSGAGNKDPKAEEGGIMIHYDIHPPKEEEGK